MTGEPSIAETRDRKDCAAQRVSKTAKRLFYQRGIRAVGVEEIVNQAGVTKPSLYRSFGSKDDLIVRTLEERFDHSLAWLDDLEARLPDDPLGQLRAIIAGIAEQATNPLYRGCPITNAAVEFPDGDHPARRLALRYKIAMRARLLHIVERLPVDQPDLLTDGLLLLFEGARASRHTSCARGPAASLRRVAEAMLDSFLPA
ncbi:TetR/AcrR family transcriptional regulator [Sphingomonas abietis]|uniref:Helix-turn-helix domain containing protein n=1 Tax=Sphingomonas abietis TaxID=3012344 RepID=A0ABY7NIJ9_9SPHN|nr:TetR/AcrR family transcriptional regulator [Sphingomonas abietis]WBO21168.1 helix-turn-helix domain containing protein [Sphingomonas abietis]